MHGLQKNAPLKLAYVTACANGSWHLEIWKKTAESEHFFIPFTCRSWRCKGRCQLWKGAQDFVRVSAGMEKRDDWVSLVLTYSPRGWRSQWQMYRAGLAQWDALRKRFVRKWGRIDYVQTWEAHRSGNPHVNVAIGNRAFWHAAFYDGYNLERDWLRPAVTEVGFGKELHYKPIYDRKGMAGYLTKLSRELTGTATKDQTPYNAPPHFRRLRSSQGLLPPCYKDKEITGCLHKRPMDACNAI